MRVLFICNQNQNRSPTAEILFRNQFETKSAGLYNQKPVDEKQLEWADVIAVMEDFQREEIANRYPNQYMKKRIVSLGIPDEYDFDAPELKKILIEKMQKVL